MSRLASLANWASDPCIAISGSPDAGLCEQALRVEIALDRDAVERDAVDAVIGEAREFIRVGHAVMVGILPHRELAEVRIVGVDQAVMIGVERGEPFGKADSRRRSRRRH